MKWFKHMSNLRNGEAVARYTEATGLEGFGFLCMVMEMITENMPPGDQRCELSLSLRRWSIALGIRPNRVLIYAKKLATSGIAIVAREGSELRIQVPKLAEWRDEYSQKSGHRRDNVGRDSSQRRIERDQKIERKIGRGAALENQDVFTNGGGMRREEDLPAHLQETAGFFSIGAILARGK